MVLAWHLGRALWVKATQHDQGAVISREGPSHAGGGLRCCPGEPPAAPAQETWPSSFLGPQWLCLLSSCCPDPGQGRGVAPTAHCPATSSTVSSTSQAPMNSVSINRGGGGISGLHHQTCGHQGPDTLWTWVLRNTGPGEGSIQAGHVLFPCHPAFLSSPVAPGQGRGLTWGLQEPSLQAHWLCVPHQEPQPQERDARACPRPAPPNTPGTECAGPRPGQRVRNRRRGTVNPELPRRRSAVERGCVPGRCGACSAGGSLPGPPCPGSCLSPASLHLDTPVGSCRAPASELSWGLC